MDPRGRRHGSWRRDNTSRRRESWRRDICHCTNVASTWQLPRRHNRWRQAQLLRRPGAPRAMALYHRHASSCPTQVLCHMTPHAFLSLSVFWPYAWSFHQDAYPYTSLTCSPCVRTREKYSKYLLTYSCISLFSFYRICI